MVYLIVACFKSGMDEEQTQGLIEGQVMREGNRPMGELYPLTTGVNKTQFKVGSLDKLMELLDSFSKFENTLDAACKRNEKLFFELKTEIKSDFELNIEISKSGRRGGPEQYAVEEYIKNFKWDQVKYQMDKSLGVLFAAIQNNNKNCEDRLKKLTDESAALRQKLDALKKKQGTSLTSQDLGDVVYENKIKKNNFVNKLVDDENYSDLFTSILVVVSKKKENDFLQNYYQFLIDHNKTDFENWKKRTLAQLTQQHGGGADNKEDDKKPTIEEQMAFEEQKHRKIMDNQLGVVPQSATPLQYEDADGNKLYTVACMIDQSVLYIKVLKKHGYSCQIFDYDANQYMKDEKQREQLKIETSTLNLKILNVCKINFQDLFQALLHLKIMKVFIDSVLRFGIPPKFFMGIIKPGKGQEAKIRKGLSDKFAEEHLKEMYGEKMDAQDEDFFPYVATELTSPEFLMGK